MDHPNSPEITTAFDDFMKAFDSFKQANDERLTQLETRMGADVVTEDKVNRINDAIDQQKRQLDHLILKAQRPSLGGDRLPTSHQLEHKAAFETYLRSGDEQAMRALEGKAMSVGSDADGGYLVPEELSNEIGRRLTALSPIRSLATVRRVSGSVIGAGNRSSVSARDRIRYAGMKETSSRSSVAIKTTKR